MAFDSGEGALRTWKMPLLPRASDLTSELVPAICLSSIDVVPWHIYTLCTCPFGVIVRVVDSTDFLLVVDRVSEPRVSMTGKISACVLMSQADLSILLPKLALGAPFDLPNVSSVRGCIITKSRNLLIRGDG